MNASNDSLATLASERIRRVAARQPDVVRLARYLSPAIRIDSPLIRAIRQEFMPGSDAGIEADLWFSPLVESVSSRGFVLDGRVAEHLRRELAGEGGDGHQVALNRVAGIIAHEHRAWSPALLLEESVIVLSLRKYATEIEKRAGALQIEALLRKAAKAMSDDEVRGLEMARWAQRALRGLPQAALETDAALLLSLGATARLGGRKVLPDLAQQRQLPPNVSWILPTKQFSSRTTVYLTRTSDGVHFGDPETFSVALSVPTTHPILVQLSWFTGPVQSARTVSVGQGSRFVPIPPTAIDIRIRTLAGEEFHLKSNVEYGDATTLDLFRACVGVKRSTSTSQHLMSLTGFLVTPDLIATVTHGLLDLSPSERLTVQWQKEEIEATVVSMSPAIELVLLRLSSPLVAAEVVPWQSQPAAVSPGALWNSLGFDNSSLVSIGGTVQSTEFPAEQAGLGGLSNSGLSYRGSFLELVSTGSASPGTSVAWSGAPIVSAGRLIGMLVAGSSDKVFYAIPAAELRDGLNSLMLGQETVRPSVFVSYGGRGHSDKDQAAAAAILEALRSLGMRTTIDIDADAYNSDDGFNAVVRMANSSSVGAVLATSTSHSLPAGQRSLLLLRFREWVDAGFGLLRFESDRGRLNPNLAGLSWDARVVELDSTSREALPGAVRSAYSVENSDIAGQDDESAISRVLEHLAVSFYSAESPDAAVIQQIIAAVPKGMTEVCLVLGSRPMGSASRKELAWTAAMFSFPSHIHLPLREVRLGSSSARAFSLNAGQPAVARALIDRAWLGRHAPRCFEVGISQLDPSPSAAAIGRVLIEAVASGLGCNVENAQWLLENSSAPYFLVLFGHATTATGFIEPLLAQFPGALIFLLLGDSPPQPSPQVVQLAPLALGMESAFLQSCQMLLSNLVAAPPPDPTTDSPLSASSPPAATAKSPQKSVRKSARKKARRPTLKRK